MEAIIQELGAWVAANPDAIPQHIREALPQQPKTDANETAAALNTQPGRSGLQSEDKSMITPSSPSY